MLAARLRVLLLVAVAAAAALALGHRDHPTLAGSGAHFACPMHPEVTGEGPTECPICGMALEKLIERVGSEPGGGDGRPSNGGAALMPDPNFSEPSADPASRGSGQRGRRAEGDAAELLSYGVAPVHHRALNGASDAPAWLDGRGGVTALFFDDEARSLAPDERAAFFPASAPKAGIAVRMVAEAPVRWHGSTSRVRFRLEGDAGAAAGLPVGATGWLTRSGKPVEALVVFSSAVLRSAAGPYLLKLAPDGRTFSKLPIEIGRVASGYTGVVSGASDRDLVVSMNAFSLDADRRLQGQRRLAGEQTP
jgi:hypothetical protein